MSINNKKLMQINEEIVSSHENKNFFKKYFTTLA